MTSIQLRQLPAPATPLCVAEQWPGAQLQERPKTSGGLENIRIGLITRNDQLRSGLLCLFHGLRPILNQLTRSSCSEFRGHSIALRFAQVRRTLRASLMKFVESYRNEDFKIMTSYTPTETKKKDFSATVRALSKRLIRGERFDSMPDAIP